MWEGFIGCVNYVPVVKKPKLCLGWDFCCLPGRPPFKISLVTNSATIFLLYFNIEI
jgi:hypothetical protein